MLRCPESHGEAFLVMSTGEMLGRMVRSGILGCPICRREFPIVKGIVNFTGKGKGETGIVSDTQPTFPVSPFPFPAVDPQTLQALLDLSGPGGYVVLLGTAARHAVGRAGRGRGVGPAGVRLAGGSAPRGVAGAPRRDRGGGRARARRAHATGGGRRPVRGRAALSHPSSAAAAGSAAA